MKRLVVKDTALDYYYDGKITCTYWNVKYEKSYNSYVPLHDNWRI